MHFERTANDQDMSSWLRKVRGSPMPNTRLPNTPRPEQCDEMNVRAISIFESGNLSLFVGIIGLREFRRSARVVVDESKDQRFLIAPPEYLPKMFQLERDVRP